MESKATSPGGGQAGAVGAPIVDRHEPSALEDAWTEASGAPAAGGAQAAPPAGPVTNEARPRGVMGREQPSASRGKTTTESAKRIDCLRRALRASLGPAEIVLYVAMEGAPEERAFVEPELRRELYFRDGRYCGPIWRDLLEGGSAHEKWHRLAWIRDRLEAMQSLAAELQMGDGMLAQLALRMEEVIGANASVMAEVEAVEKEWAELLLAKDFAGALKLVEGCSFQPLVPSHSVAHINREDIVRFATGWKKGRTATLESFTRAAASFRALVIRNRAQPQDVAPTVREWMQEFTKELSGQFGDLRGFRPTAGQMKLGCAAFRCYQTGLLLLPGASTLDRHQATMGAHAADILRKQAWPLSRKLSEYSFDFLDALRNIDDGKTPEARVYLNIDERAELKFRLAAIRLASVFGIEDAIGALLANLAKLESLADKNSARLADQSFPAPPPTVPEASGPAIAEEEPSCATAEVPQEQDETPAPAPLRAVSLPPPTARVRHVYRNGFHLTTWLDDDALRKRIGDYTGKFAPGTFQFGDDGFNCEYSLTFHVNKHHNGGPIENTLSGMDDLLQDLRTSPAQWLSRPVKARSGGADYTKHTNGTKMLILDGHSRVVTFALGGVEPAAAAAASKARRGAKGRRKKKGQSRNR